MALGIHFDIFGSLYAPVPGLIVSLVICVELGEEGLDIAFIIIIPCAVLLRSYLRIARIIALIGSVRGIVDGLGDSL